MMNLLLTTVSVTVVASSEWLKLGDGVAVDEGKGVGDFKGCDLECCKAKCEATASCNSFAFSSTSCYLKDKCIFAGTPTKRSAYKTYFRPCPEAGLIESTCGKWTGTASSATGQSAAAGDASATIQEFIRWQNCVVDAKMKGQVRGAFMLQWRSVLLVSVQRDCDPPR
jgi:hypothetical protein